MSTYDPKEIEKKWQDAWSSAGLYATKDTGAKKKYILDMFPYPSGEGLHVGHPKGYIATDVYSRSMRMQGYSVLHPMGFDAFGLPAEEYAIKTKTNPAVAVAKNVARYKKQLELIGFDYDWSREVNTTDPEYYRWTQWIFLQLLKKGLAFESTAPINWCPSCKTGLANEDLDGGVCERCGSVVEKKPMRQWVLKITNYADRLVDDLNLLEHWPAHIKEQQRNWIGRSVGAEVAFDDITVFTTRPDTILGATYVVIAPEHPLAQGYPEAAAYIAESKNKSDIERTAEGKGKTGVKIALSVTNPATGEKVPVYVADYVLGHYGTGAVMGVPAHDERDRAFAEAMGIAVTDTPLIPLDEAISKYGTAVTKYKLQDWVFSRQRYWGEPIPVIHCPEHGAVPVPESDLPVVLPPVEQYEPTGTGESPLAAIESWVHTTCPTCGKPAQRETNTMPQWAGSCWYYLRYMDPKNESALVSKERESHWQSVDLYVGGAEHATRHLIYARFWHKFLFDIGVVTTAEPFLELHSVGLIQASDGRKMSKRWGNVVNPDSVVEQFGADSLRVYEMFMGPFENAIAWSTDGLVGARRFIERVYGLSQKVRDDDTALLTVPMHQTIKKVSDDIAAFKFNTAISQMMIFLNEVDDAIGKRQYESLLKLLAPFAPHVTEELWHRLGHTTSIHLEPWPTYDPAQLESGHVTVAVQVGGKLRGTITVPRGTDEAGLKAAIEKDAALLAKVPATPSRVIVVIDKIINFIA